MDANGTRFHLLLGSRDWTERTDLRRATATGVEWSHECEELALVALPFEFKAGPADRAPEIDDRRGGARDRFGNWYWIDETATGIYVRSTGSGLTSQFWRTVDASTCAGETRKGQFGPAEPALPPRIPARLRGLAVTEDHYLVAGVLEPAGLIVFDLHAGGSPVQLCWPDRVGFAPFDMARRAGGGVWVLDRLHDRVWQLDEQLNVVRRVPPSSSVRPPIFQPVAGGATSGDASSCDPLLPITSGDAWAAPANAVAIEALPGNALLVMDRSVDGASTLHYFASIGATPQPLPLSEYAVAGHDVAFVPSESRGVPALMGRVYVVAPEGNQAYAFMLARDGHGGAALTGRVPEYFPMRLFEGKGLVVEGGNPYYDFDGSWIPLIQQKRPRHVERGVVNLDPLDGREPDCVWHRLMLDGCVPPGTSVEIWSRTGNTFDELNVADWQREPDLCRRRTGSELPFVPSPRGVDTGTWELLLQQAQGRYLRIRIVMHGDGRLTPRLRALRVYYPRFSYLERYLPGVYREDTSSASFLDRYLANVEGILTPIEDRIAAIQALFDVRSAPADALDWLASWLGLALDPSWDEQKRRLIIAHATEFFQRRGTIQGLQMALGLTLFDCATPEMFPDPTSPRSCARAIRVVEKFRSREAPAVIFGDPTELRGPRIAATQTRWTPKEGRDALYRRYRKYLESRGVVTDAQTVFSLCAPPGADAAQRWREFARQTLGFVPAIASTKPGLWRDFLARRYHGIAAFNEVYTRTGHAATRGFDTLSVPSTVPPDGAPSVDWYDFESIVLSIYASAHRFVVLLPMRPGVEADADEHRVRLELAKRIVALEKPAHTTFEVRFYWSLFRLGEARLGQDTLVDRGGRAPELLTPMVLDRGHLGESYLAPSHPQNVDERQIVIGRERLDGQPC